MHNLIGILGDPKRIRARDTPAPRRELWGEYIPFTGRRHYKPSVLKILRCLHYPLQGIEIHAHTHVHAPRAAPPPAPVKSYCRRYHAIESRTGAYTGVLIFSTRYICNAAAEPKRPRRGGDPPPLPAVWTFAPSLCVFPSDTDPPPKPHRLPMYSRRSAAPLPNAFYRRISEKLDRLP